MSDERPNVLLIMSDQHNAQVMGCAGDPVVETPHLDRLAQGGVVLENLYCQAPLCAPSRMSFMSGMLPSQCGVQTNEQILSSAHPTLAHAAGAAGYRPYLSGKMHALGPDQLLGFVDREVGDHGPNYAGAGTPSARGVLDSATGPNMTSLTKIGPGRNAYQVRDEYAAEAVISYLHRHAIEQRSTLERNPFFVSVGLMLPHQPYVARREDYERYAGRVGPPRVAGPVTDVDRHPFLSWWRETTGLGSGVPEEAVLKARTAYWAMVDRMDRILGTILEAVENLGVSDNTLVVYTSDHGDHIGEHGLWWKQTLLDPAVKVPGVLSWPGVIPAGTRSDRVAGLVDINATIIDALDGPPLPRSVGRSMLNVLSGTDQSWPDIAIAEHCVDRDQPSGVGDIDVDVPTGHYQRMVRRGRYKYVDYGHQQPQLFDLADDPEETRDRIDDPKLADVVAELAAHARTGWDPDEVIAETRTSLAEVRLIRDWARAVDLPERYRFAMNPRYNALDEPETDLHSSV